MYILYPYTNKSVNIIIFESIVSYISDVIHPCFIKTAAITRFITRTLLLTCLKLLTMGCKSSYNIGA